MTNTTNTDALRDSIRAAGGIVHSDGNIFFTNEAKFLAAASAALAAPAQPSASERAAFERWQGDVKGLDLQELSMNAGGDYDYDDIQNEWVAWQYRSALAAPAQAAPAQAVPTQAGEYPELSDCKYAKSGDIKDFGLYTAHQMRVYADATCAARGAAQREHVASDALLDVVAHLAGAASAYRTYAKRAPHLGKVPADALFTTRVADMDKAVERGRVALGVPGAAPVDAAGDAILAHLDGLKDDAAAHIYPIDLERCATSECTATVFSVRVGCPDGESVPLFSREQVVEAIDEARAAQEGK